MHAKPIFKPTAFDHLESREVLSTMSVTGLHPAAALAPVGNTMKNVTQALNQVYNAFVSNGGNVLQLAKEFPTIQFNGNSVAVIVNGKGAFSTLLANVKNAGMTVSVSSATYDMVVGFVPISSLPKLANLPDVVSISPVVVRPTYPVMVAPPTAHPLLLMTPRPRL